MCRQHPSRWTQTRAPLTFNPSIQFESFTPHTCMVCIYQPRVQPHTYYQPRSVFKILFSNGTIFLLFGLSPHTPPALRRLLVSKTDNDNERQLISKLKMKMGAPYTVGGPHTHSHSRDGKVPQSRQQTPLHIKTHGTHAMWTLHLPIVCAIWVFPSNTFRILFMSTFLCLETQFFSMFVIRFVVFFLCCGCCCFYWFCCCGRCCQS